MFIDTHCHLNTDSFDQDFDEVLMRMNANLLSKVINVGFDPKNSRKSVELSEKYNFMYATVGLHPHEAKNLTEEILLDFENLIKSSKKIVAIGETGLDFFRNLSTKEEQEKAFVAQINLAKKYDLPVILHCRDAYEDVLNILNQNNVTKAVFHCYAGDLAFAKKAWEKGFYTSFSGILTYPKNDYLREVAINCPENLFLFETDCPYLSPQNHRGERNEPAFMIETAKCFAEIKSLDLKRIADLEAQNVKNIFGI